MARTTEDTPDTSAPSQCSLLTLPPELRLIIYNEVFTTLKFNSSTFHEGRLQYSPLLKTCTLIRDEALQTYFFRACDFLVATRIQYEAVKNDTCDLLAQLRQETDMKRRDEVSNQCDRTLEEAQKRLNFYIEAKRVVYAEIRKWEATGYDVEAVWKALRDAHQVG